MLKNILTKSEEDISNEYYVALQNMIHQEVINCLSNINFEKYMDVAVISYDEKTKLCICKDLGTKEIYDDIINYTSDTLAAGNIVRIYYNGQDRFIGRHLTRKE